MTGWFSAAQIAELALPGLPRDKRKVNKRAETESWALRTGASGDPLVRRRGRCGGGWEYHYTVLPAAARAAILKRGLAEGAAPLPIEAKRAERWIWFERQSDKVRDEARRRLAIIDTSIRQERAGSTRTMAVACAAVSHQVSPATIWNWLRDIEGIHPHDWLPYLAPDRRGGGVEREIDGDLFRFIQSDYLRLSKPTWESCYYRAQRAFPELEMPASRTLKRKFDRETPAQLIALKRNGGDALRSLTPHQRRTVADMHAMELVNIDGHECDVFVQFPGRDKPIRPTFLAIADIYSRKFLAWVIAETEDSVAARGAFLRLFKSYGIPKALLADNGHAFASKWITGGIPNRYRFKVKDDEPTGLMSALGIEVVWAMPYRGSSKPIERGFRDFCDHAAKHPAFEGAYTGNSPMAKPDNYGSRAVPLAVFERIWADCIAAHNAKPGRRTEMAHGRSFDQVFAESFADAPIGRATPAQLRMAMLMPAEKRCHPKSGEIELDGNRYWVPELVQLAGQRVIVRFDPDDLHREIHVYSRDGRYLVQAEIIEDVGFRDSAAAKLRARQIAEFKKATKALDAAAHLLTHEQLAERMPAMPDEDLIEPSVVRPIRHRGQTAAALKPMPAQRPHASVDVADRLARLTLVKS